MNNATPTTDDAAPAEPFRLSAPCSYYVDLEGTLEHHAPSPYLVPNLGAVIVAEPGFSTLGGACYPDPGGTFCYRSLLLNGERLGVTGRLVGETECVWRDARAQ